MAVLKLKSSSNTVAAIRAYLERDDRHVARTTFNIDDDQSWDKDMVMTKLLHQKTDGRQYELIVQSFDKKDDISIDDAHRAGCDLAEEFYGKGYQVVVITHDDTDNLHNHIVVNSVNSETGEKIHISNAKERERERDILSKELYRKNDEICKKYGFLTLTESKRMKTEREREEGKQATSYKTDERYVKHSYKESMRNSLQAIFSDSSIQSVAEFEKALEKRNLKISRVTGTGNITYVDRDGHKARGTSLGEFNKDDVLRFIEQNNALEREHRSRDQVRVRVIERERTRGRSR